MSLIPTLPENLACPSCWIFSPRIEFSIKADPQKSVLIFNKNGSWKWRLYGVLFFLCGRQKEMAHLWIEQEYSGPFVRAQIISSHFFVSSFCGLPIGFYWFPGSSRQKLLITCSIFHYIIIKFLIFIHFDQHHENFEQKKILTWQVMLSIIWTRL